MVILIMSLWLVVVYIFVVFVGIWLVVPYYGFNNPKRKKVPDEYLKVIDEINNRSKNNVEYLKNVYDFLTSKYYGSKIELFTKWNYAFDDIFSHKMGFIPCNIFNQILKTMLLQSQRFEEKDIRKRIVLLNFFIHQYLQVRVEDKWIDVDLEYKNIGIPFGKHASIFC